MTPIIIAACNALHALAAMIFIGHYLLLSLLYLPVLTRIEAGGGKALGEISRRSRPWIYASILVFFFTGIVLMIVDSNYQGIGNFNNPWAVLMLVKHIFILAMLVIGFWYNAIRAPWPRLYVRTRAMPRTRPVFAATAMQWQFAVSSF